MGISDFHPLLKRYCPHCEMPYKLSFFRGYRCAVDISVFLYKYIRSAGPTRWVDTFVQLLCVMKKNGIRPVCIFDGPNPPPEKTKEREERRANLFKITEKMNEAVRIRNIIRDKYVPTKKPVIDSIATDVRNILRLDAHDYRVDNRWKAPVAPNFYDPLSVVRSLNVVIEKYERQTLPITPEYGEKAKEIVSALGVEWFQADGEAEGMCAYLAVHGQVDAVITTDTDVLAYGTPIMLADIDLTKESTTVLVLKDILDSLNLTYESFRDLCIMLECDYNSRAKTWSKKGTQKGVGMVKSYELITEHGCIENFEDTLVDPSVLKYQRCRELFSVPPIIPEHRVRAERDFDEVKFDELIQRLHITISKDYVSHAFERTAIIFKGRADPNLPDFVEE